MTQVHGWFYGIWYPPVRPLPHDRRIQVMEEWKNNLYARKDPFWKHWQTYTAAFLLMVTLVSIGAACQGELWVNVPLPWLWRVLLGIASFLAYNAAMRFMYMPYMKALDTYLHITGQIRRSEG